MLSDRITRGDVERYTNIEENLFGHCIFETNPRADYGLQMVMRCLLHNRLKDKTLVISGDTDREVGNYELRMDLVDPAYLTARGFEPMPKIERYFSQNGVDGKCFINMERKSVWITAAIMRATTAHVVACIIPAIFPWFFEKEPLTSSEQALIRALAESTKDDFLDKLKRCVDELGIDDIVRRDYIRKINKQIAAAFSRKYETELENVESQIENKYRDIETLLQRRLGLQDMIIGAKSRKCDYGEVFDDPSIVIENIEEEDGYMNITFLSTAWAADDGVLENESSYIYEEFCNVAYIPLMMKLLREIFVTRELKMHMTGAFKFDFGTRYLVSREYQVYDVNNYMANPHLFYYSCTGGYRPCIEQACRDGNLQYALELAKASTGNINFSDYTVMRSFVHDILENARSGDCRCLEDKNGKRMTIKEWWENEQRNAND